MKIAYLFFNSELNGNKDFFLEKIKENKNIFCADGGANLCFDLNLIPKEIWGDLDSIKDEVKKFYLDKKVKFKKFKPEKDFTDSELILNEIYSKFDKIFCIGALGGSLAHELSNINLLARFQNLIFLTEKEKIFKVNNNFIFKNLKNKKISFVPLSDEIKNITLNGFKYDVSKLNLKQYEARCISNIINENTASIEYESGLLLCILEN